MLLVLFLFVAFCIAPDAGCFVFLQGLDKEWTNLLSLVTHHTVMPEMLPCTLRLPRDTNNPAFKDCDKDEKEEDPDYQRLADFTSMMEALKQ